MDLNRRKKCDVPGDVEYRTLWQIALKLLDRSRRNLPHKWVAGANVGHSAKFRQELRYQRELYALTVPSDTVVAEQDQGWEPGRRGRPRFCPAWEWAKRLPRNRWTPESMPVGATGPRNVEAIVARVLVKDEGKVCTDERLLVVRPHGRHEEAEYVLTNAAAEGTLTELLRVLDAERRVGRLFETARRETGLADYEIRGWHGWHRHTIMSLLALWYRSLEQLRASAATRS
jgi:hypothetical protein